MSLQLDHWPRRRRAPTAYAMLRKRYSRQALQHMGFQLDSQGRFVKLGACRTLLAEASSPDGISWRVRPFVRHWR